MGVNCGYDRCHICNTGEEVQGMKKTFYACIQFVEPLKEKGYSFPARKAGNVISEQIVVSCWQHHRLAALLYKHHCLSQKY